MYDAVHPKRTQALLVLVIDTLNSVTPAPPGHHRPLPAEAPAGCLGPVALQNGGRRGSEVDDVVTRDFVPGGTERPLASQVTSGRREQVAGDVDFQDSVELFGNERVGYTAQIGPELHRSNVDASTLMEPDVSVAKLVDDDLTVLAGRERPAGRLPAQLSFRQVEREQLERTVSHQLLEQYLTGLDDDSTLVAVTGINAEGRTHTLQDDARHGDALAELGRVGIDVPEVGGGCQIHVELLRRWIKRKDK